jgi:hypothetical protein
MKFLRIFAIVQIVAALVYCATGILSILVLRIGINFGQLTALPVVFTLAINACWIFMLAASAFWLRRSVSSVSFLFFNAIFTAAVFIMTAAFTFAPSDIPAGAAGPLIVVFFSIIPVLSWIFFFKAGKAGLNANAGILRRAPIAVLSSLIVLCAVVFILLRNGTFSVPLPVQNAFEGKDVPSKSIIRIYDGSDLTWWTPTDKSGIDSFVTLETRNPGYISGIVISGGAHFPETLKAPLSRTSYSRPEKISVELSNGQKYNFTCKDIPDAQEFSFPSGIAHWVRITFHSTYKGEKFDELCVSEISVLGERTFFRK